QLSVQADSLQRDAAEASSFADRLAAAAAQVNQVLSQSLRDKQLHALSLSLAAELQEGAPCPVCGSEHHPRPAASSGQSEDNLDESMDRLTQITHQIQEARLTLRGQLNESEALASQTRSQIESYGDDE
ncbi:SMC family ATPase, partial [Clostridium perfringens]